jgi:hypothetical protein
VRLTIAFFYTFLGHGPIMQISQSPWLALGFSLVIHTGLGLALFLGASGDGDDLSDSSFALESCVLLADGVQADPPASPASSQPPNSGGNEEQENGNFTATVTDLQPREMTIEETTNQQSAATGQRPARPSSSVRGTGAGRLGEAGVSFCGVAGKGNRVVYVIDRSLSMGLNGTFRRACDQLLTSLEQLPAEARFQVLLYNRHAEPLRINGTAELFPADAQTKDQVRLLVRQTRSEGATDHLAALKAALRLHPDVIYFATDADDLTEKTIDAVTDYNKAKTAIHTIEVTRWPDAERTLLMKRLAQSNGGTYRAVVVKSQSD